MHRCVVHDRIGDALEDNVHFQANTQSFIFFPDNFRVPASQDSFRGRVPVSDVVLRGYAYNDGMYRRQKVSDMVVRPCADPPRPFFGP
jgi:hypothetical protein